MIRVTATRFFRSDEEEISIEIALSFDVENNITWDTTKFAAVPIESLDLPNFKKDGKTIWREMTNEEALQYIDERDQYEDLGSYKESFE